MNTDKILPTLFFGALGIAACLIFYGNKQPAQEAETNKYQPSQNITLEEAFKKGEAAEKKAADDLIIIRTNARRYELNQTTVYCSATGAAYWAYHNTRYGQDVSIAPAFDLSIDGKPPRILNCEEAQKILESKSI